MLREVLAERSPLTSPRDPDPGVLRSLLCAQAPWIYLACDPLQCYLLCSTSFSPYNASYFTGDLGETSNTSL